MVTDDDYLILSRELMLIVFDIQAEIGTLRLAVQKHGITLEELAECRKELDRRLSLADRRARIQALGRLDLAQALKDFSGPIQ